PAIIPAAAISSPYMPKAANWPISRKGEPGSRSCASRWRGKSLPRATCRSRASAGPPSAIVAALAAMSATSARICSAFALKLSEAGEMAERMTGMADASADQFDGAGQVEPGPGAVCGDDGGAEFRGGGDAGAVCKG